MDTKGSELISALEHFWNGWVTSRKEKDVILIVCTSATYWIVNKIVNSKGGLHNRLTGVIHLRPFTLAECDEYLKSRKIVWNRHQIIQCYMVLGGVPHYWSLIKKGKSLPQNIDELFFREGAPLQNEYDNLYRALFHKPDQYMKIIEALCRVNKGITRDEICRKTRIPSSGELTKKLQELTNCGFIRKYTPFGSERKNTLYQLIDNYTLFCYEVTSCQALFLVLKDHIVASPDGIPKGFPDSTVPGLDHSVIRGFGFRLTDRSMVRRERYSLLAWITVSCANIERS